LSTVTAAVEKLQRLQILMRYLGADGENVKENRN